MDHARPANGASSSFKLALAILALALATLIVYRPIHPTVTHLNHSGYESVELACSLASGHGFADPFWVAKTGPSAHLAPLFPAFLALLIKIAPGPAAAYFLMECAATAIVLLQLCLLPILSQRFGFGMASGLIAAFLWLLGRVPREAVWEQNYVGVIVCILAMLMYSSFRESFSVRQSAVCGVLWGVALLLCPVTVLVLLAWIAVLLFTKKQAASRIASIVLVPILMVLPWTVRNYMTFKHFVFVRDNLGTELAVSNNPCASFSFEMTTLSGCFAQHHPNENAEQAARVASLGEYEYNRQQLANARTWITNNLGRFAELTAKRAVAFWFPSVLGAELSIITDESSRSAWRDAIISVSSLIAAFGLMVGWKRNPAAILVVTIWLATFPLVYYMTQYFERYRTPVVWAIFIPAGIGLTELWRSVVPNKQQAAFETAVEEEIAEPVSVSLDRSA